MNSPMLASDAANTQFVGASDPDAALHVTFYKRQVKQTFLSAQEGIPIFKSVDYVKIFTPGNQLNIVDTPVREDHKRRFPKQWAYFQNNQSGGEAVGIPINQWGAIEASLAESLKALKFYTVEQVAFASDEQIGRLGMLAGMNPMVFRDRAKAYLTVAKDASALQKKDEELAAMKARMEKLEAMVLGQAPAAPSAPQPAVDNANVATGATPFSDGDVRAALAAQYKAKFGKDPHHKMKAETIREKLAA